MGSRHRVVLHRQDETERVDMPPHQGGAVLQCRRVFDLNTPEILEDLTKQDWRSSPQLGVHHLGRGRNVIVELAYRQSEPEEPRAMPQEAPEEAAPDEEMSGEEKRRRLLDDVPDSMKRARQPQEQEPGHGQEHQVQPMDIPIPKR